MSLDAEMNLGRVYCSARVPPRELFDGRSIEHDGPCAHNAVLVRAVGDQPQVDEKAVE